MTLSRDKELYAEVVQGLLEGDPLRVKTQDHALTLYGIVDESMDKLIKVNSTNPNDYSKKTREALKFAGVDITDRKTWVEAESEPTLTMDQLKDMFEDGGLKTNLLEMMVNSTKNKFKLHVIIMPTNTSNPLFSFVHEIEDNKYLVTNPEELEEIENLVLDGEFAEIIMESFDCDDLREVMKKDLDPLEVKGWITENGYIKPMESSRITSIIPRYKHKNVAKGSKKTMNVIKAPSLGKIENISVEIIEL